MDADKLLEYLRYLRGRIDALQGTRIVGLQEIAPLQSELRLLRDRVATSGFLSQKIREHFSVADIHVAPIHLAGSGAHFWATWWMSLPLLRLFRAARQGRDKE